MSSTEEVEAKPEEVEAKPEETQQDQEGAAESKTAEEPKAEQETGEKQPAPAEAQPQEEEEEEEEEEEPDDGVPRVLVTGASGYIALHVTKRLLEDGRFRVRGSVRNKKNKEKIQPLLNLVPDAKYPIRLVQADLTKPESWKKAVKTCSYVFHLASPFPAPNAPQTDEVLTPQAVDGTLSVLKACVEAGTVKRVILTSSIAAISNGNVGDPAKPADYRYSESDWSNEAYCQPYEKSKLRAERAAWDFVKNLDEDKRFELVVVNPGYVQGPLLSPVGGDGTKALCVPLLSAEMPGVPDISFPTVDVRDVAEAEMAALEKPEAAGNRYALVTDTLNYRGAARMVAEEFKPQGYKIPTAPIPKALLWVMKPFRKDVRDMYPYVGKIALYNNEKMVRELGVTPHEMKQTILDTCYSLIELGLVKKTPQYLGHPSTRPPPVTEQPAASGDAAATVEPAETGASQEAAADTPGAGDAKETGGTEKTGDPPAETSDPPAETSDPPAETSDPPAETGDPPAETSDPPAETSDPPAETGDPPAETSDPPAETGDPPAETSDPPAETGDPPAETSDPPAAGEEGAPKEGTPDKSEETAAE